jgi:arsenate reductase
MSNITIYHNPRCSKSRQTLEILEDKGHKPEVKLYLEQAPSSDELKDVLEKLDLEPRSLMRIKEEEYRVNHLDDENLSDEQLINAMVRYPKLIERPIVLANGKAIIGRPPENVLEII